MKLITYFAGICLMCSLALNMFGSDDRSELAVDEVFALLTSTPTWGRSDTDTRLKQIADAYVKVARYDDATIREAMEKYLLCCLGGEKCNSAHEFSMENMVVLNRFVFNVPEHISRENLRKLPFYFGMDTPDDGENVNLLWPLVVEKDGSFVLQPMSVFHTRDGPGPDALREFDIFQKAFGRRVPVQK
jgi:hypothetical protein